MGQTFGDRIPGLWANQYELGFASLSDAFGISSSALSFHHESAVLQRALHDQESEDGDVYDDDILIYTRSNKLDSDVNYASEAMIALNLAFITAAYHFWERSVRRRAGKSAIDKSGLKNAAIKLGYSIHPELDILRHLNNVIKHHSKSGAKAVHKWDNSLFIFGKLPKRNYADSLVIGSKEVIRLGTIVKQSGPMS